MKIVEMAIPGVLKIEPVAFKDNRGHFLELFHLGRFSEHGLPAEFRQDNLSYSTGGVLRGLHYQLGHQQGKLVMAVQGEIFDVAVDLRGNSPTFGKWVGAFLSSDNRYQMFIPEGFAHGFCTLSEEATVLYKCTDYYAPKEERGLRWDDPALAIEWPVADPILSAKDRCFPFLGAILPEDLPRF